MSTEFDRIATGGTTAWAWLSSVIDEIDYGIVLLVGARVRCLNRVARAQLADGALRLEGDLLVARGDANVQAWRKALEAAGCRGLRQMVALRAAADTLHVAVVPLAAAGDGAEEATVMVVLGKRGVCPDLTAHWFCRHHGLTAAESRVLADLLEGLPASTIARRNGVALSTVRTQISSIRSKTSIRGVRQLLVAAATLPPVVPVVVPQAYS